MRIIDKRVALSPSPLGEGLGRGTTIFQNYHIHGKP